MAWHRIDDSEKMASGDRVTAVIDGREILICLVGEDYYALASRCTHSAWPLVGEPIEGAEIICTLHGARFDLRDGCPTLGPASKPLSTYSIERRDGALYVDVNTTS